MTRKELHPQANILALHILEARKGFIGGAKHYIPLANWQVAQGLSDDRANDLYQRIAVRFDFFSFPVIPHYQRVSGISDALWESEESAATSVVTTTSRNT